MKVEADAAVRFGGFAEIPAPFNSIRSARVVSKSRQARGVTVDVFEALHLAQHVDYRFGNHSGNGSAADMAQPCQPRFQRPPQQRRFRCEKLRPIWVVWANKLSHITRLAPSYFNRYRRIFEKTHQPDMEKQGDF